MAVAKGTMIVGTDMAIKGSIRNCRMIEIAGYVEGEISAQSLIIHEGGRFSGILRAEVAEVNGDFTGTASVKNLFRIGGGGSVSGNVRYGELAMERGAELTADVKNVPPSIFGDLDLTVDRGGAVIMTIADLTALDPDDVAAALTFAVSRPMNGHVELAAIPGRPVPTFTQAQLEAGQVAFRHNGSAGGLASFEVVVADHTGASSGAAKTVHVTVR